MQDRITVICKVLSILNKNERRSDSMKLKVGIKKHNRNEA
jgi:hypothetical protein